MLYLNKYKGGENNCGIRIEESDIYKNDLLNMIAQIWILKLNKSVSWVKKQKGYFLMPYVKYDPDLDYTTNKSCTDFNNHIHIYDIEQINYGKNKDKYILYLSLKHCNYHINPIKKIVFDVRANNDQNFTIEAVIDKPFDFELFSEIISDKLINIYLKAIKIYNEFSLSKGIKTLSINHKKK
jgi:hypothetical protein